MKTKFSKRDAIIIAAALAIGLIIGKVSFSNNKKSFDKHEHELVKETKNGETIWTCSMHPQIRKSEPGNCPICGMELIPANDGGSTEEASDPNEIQMSASAMKLADVQTVIVKRGIPDKKVFLLGKVKADERNIAELTARFGGRIEKLYVNYKGQQVHKGEKLASIYSPDLITAQRELLEAAKYKNDNPGFYRAARTKLKLWDLTKEQIDRIEKDGEPIINFDILSPISGTVMRRDVALGDYVKEGNPLFEVIDLHKVWVMFDAYESDLPWIKKGDKINFSMEALPGKIYTGRVSYIDPFINPSTRIAQVRIEMNNPKLKFKPNMFASGILESNIAEKSDALLIPKSSILWTGKRAVVYVKVPNRKNPSFIYRVIDLGPEAGNFYVVASGLMEGEEIATNGVFKIDASAQLAGKPSMMNPEGGKVNTMPGMDMGPSTNSTNDETTSKAVPKKMTDDEMKAMDTSTTKTKLSSKMTKEEMATMNTTKKVLKKEKTSEMKCSAGKCGK